VVRDYRLQDTMQLEDVVDLEEAKAGASTVTVVGTK
jgi:hypothetical protein